MPRARGYLPRAESAPHLSEAAFRLVFDGAFTGNFIASPRGRLLACNPALAQLLGFDTVGEAMRQPVQSWFPKGSIYHALMRRLKAEKEVTVESLALQTARRQRLQVLAKVWGQFDAAGRLAWFAGYLLDVTAQKEAEAIRQRLALGLAKAAEAERARLSLELHDQAGQDLTALKLGLGVILRQSRLPEPVRERLNQLEGVTDKLMRTVHRLAWELRPSVLDDVGLDQVLRRYVLEWSEQHGIAVDYQSSGLKDKRLAPPQETALYRIAQEALTNVVKHAGARHVGVLLQRGADHVSLIVEDDGQGLELPEPSEYATANGKLGLLGMRERATMLNGTFTLESSPGGGTTIFVRLPLGN